jgi:2-polyprenyl-6-methoxyphenol hydroxylase-like FAD-dependent oxidoreductase
LYDATRDTTAWRFGDQIVEMVEGTQGVDVKFHSGKEEMFDAVVLADGVGSRTRKLAFPPEDIQFKNLGVCELFLASVSRIRADAA